MKIFNLLLIISVLILSCSTEGNETTQTTDVGPIEEYNSLVDSGDFKIIVTSNDSTNRVEISSGNNEVEIENINQKSSGKSQKNTNTVIIGNNNKVRIKNLTQEN